VTRAGATVIFGLGVTGYSALRFLYGREPLTVVDTREHPPNLAQARAAFPDVRYLCGNVDRAVLSAARRIVVSPGVPLDHCWLRHPVAFGVPIESDIGLFLAEAVAPVIGITGTNGKSTVTALVGHLLAAAGLDVGVGGNLGEPALDLLAPNRDAYVLELSSFQLERLAEPALDAACILNVTPDHLDRYADMAAYAASKQPIYARCRVAICNRDDRLTRPVRPNAYVETVGLDRPSGSNWGIADADGTRRFARGDQSLLDCGAVRLRGKHNEFNVLAALALAATRVPIDGNVLAALASFEGLPHRCVTVAVVDGISFIDDSKATNLGACRAALEGLGDAGRKHIVLIAGGDAKGADLAPLREPVGTFVRSVITLGKDAALVEAAIGATPHRRVANMDEAVVAARAAARAGDIVLLSPACSSLDMFRNYAARGDAFAAAARRLAK